MDAQIQRHQPLITARLIFKPKVSSPPPTITAWMEFPPISVPSLTTKKRLTTPKRAITPINTKRSVAFDNYLDLGSPLSPLPEEQDDLESEEDGEASKKIPKPPGVVGRPQSGGYNLQDMLQWNDRTYETIMVSL